MAAPALHWLGWGLATALAIIAAPLGAQVQPITSGDFTDYQPAPLRASDNTLMVVFERLDAVGSGDLWLSRSVDDGASWDDPVPIIATADNERHPALLQLDSGGYVLFYLKGTGSAYRIFRATSADGMTFSEQGAVDLGWGSAGDINPHVIHVDDKLVMSYQRLSPAGTYIAQSADGGTTWDTLRTPIASGAMLPRIAWRASDGLYLASYQVNPGNNQLRMYIKTTRDMHDWSAPARDFAVTGNNHDSLPIVMPDDAFVMFWIRASGGQFDIGTRRSLDGIAWEAPLAVTASAGDNDVEPHPLVGMDPHAVELYWGRERPLGSGRYAIVRQSRVIVSDMIFADAFDP